MRRCLLLVVCALQSSAQTDLSVKEAVTRALQANQLLTVSRDRIAVNQGLQRQAGLSFNPRLILQNENVRPYGSPAYVYPRDTDHFAYLQQTFETAGKRQHRIDAAGSVVRRSELERDLLSRQIGNRVKQAYWTAVGARQAEELLEESGRNFQRIVEYHEIRVKEGAMAEVDLIRVRLEGERLAIARITAALEAERARIQLFREMGEKEFPPVRFTDRLEMPSGEAVASDVNRALEQRVEVQLARQIVEQARANLRLQQSNARPNIDVLFGYKRTTGLDTMMGGLQFDLPLANRNQGNVAAALAEIRVGESAVAATEALIRAEVAAAQKEYEIRRRQIGDSLASMRRNAGETARIAEAAYREGGTDLLRLLDAQRLRIETELLYYRALTEYRQSLAALEAAVGVEP